MQKNHAKAVTAFRTAAIPTGKLPATPVVYYRDATMDVKLDFGVFDPDNGDLDSVVTAPIVVLLHHGTAIAVRTEAGEIIVNLTGYSPTTTRLQNAIMSSLTPTYLLQALPKGVDGDDLIAELMAGRAI